MCLIQFVDFSAWVTQEYYNWSIIPCVIVDLVCILIDNHASDVKMIHLWDVAKNAQAEHTKVTMVEGIS